MISRETIDKVLNEANIVEVIGSFVDLKKQGSNWIGRSPFTEEKTPSFSVSESKQLFKDFSGGLGGNVITFLKEHNSLSFPEAIRYLAEKYHIEVIEDREWKKLSKEDREKKQKEQETYRALMNWSVGKYHQHLLKAPADSNAKLEIEKRGYSLETLHQWRLGYAPAYSKVIREAISSKGKVQEATDINLLGPKGEKLNDRLLFPIQDADGNYIGLAGRDLSGSAGSPKYINPPDTPLYKKDQTLYGLNFARTAIRKRKFAYLAEGYTDVIRMHEVGLENTVAGCGTNITVNQVKLLKRYTNSVVLVFDNDSSKKRNAGQEATLKYIDLFYEYGFEVHVCGLPDGEDPDSFFQDPLYRDTYLAYGQSVTDEVNQEGFFFKSEILLSRSSSTQDKSDAVNDLVRITSYKADETIREYYLKHIQQQFGTGLTHIKKAVSNLIKERNKRMTDEQRKAFFQQGKEEEFELPRKFLKMGGSWADIKDDVLNYGLISYNNTLFTQQGDYDPKSKHAFREVSNFSIEIIQHINSDEDERSIRLVRMINEHGTTITYDTQSTNFVELNSFKRMVESKGNYRFRGDRTDYERIKHKLYEEMGDGRLIEQLGWQPEGFWAFNNAVIIDGKVSELDDNGCFSFKGRQYYVKSGNKLYEHMHQKFGNQKLMIYEKPVVDFNEFLARLIQVHEERAYNLLLFSIATVFSDIVYDRVRFFPLMFLYGEAGTGKDEVIAACQGLFGRPQPKIKITGKANTDKGKIRKFAEFINTPVHLSEYKNVNEYVDEEMKALWDRDGYTRADKDSKYLTEEVPILSTCVFTGNYYPVEDALLTRIIAEEFTKTSFTDEEKVNFGELKEILDQGVSGFLVDILEHRPDFSIHFRKAYNSVSKELRMDLSNIGLTDRMVNNAAVLGATYRIFEDKVSFPFTYEQWKVHVANCLQRQQSKRSMGSVISRFWDCFLEGMRDRHNGIKNYMDFSVDAGEISIRTNYVYPKYTDIHFRSFREKAPAKSSWLDKITKSEAFVKTKSSKRFGPGSKSNALVFCLDRIHNSDEILEMVSIQDKGNQAPKEASVLDNAGDKVPQTGANPSTENKSEPDDLPF